MTSYLVAWECEIEADSPAAAAREALAMHRDPDSIATCFLVTDEGGAEHVVDLSEGSLG